MGELRNGLSQLKKFGGSKDPTQQDFSGTTISGPNKEEYFNICITDLVHPS